MAGSEGLISQNFHAVLLASVFLCFLALLAGDVVPSWIELGF